MSWTRRTAVRRWMRSVCLLIQWSCQVFWRAGLLDDQNAAVLSVEWTRRCVANTCIIIFSQCLVQASKDLCCFKRSVVVCVCMCVGVGVFYLKWPHQNIIVRRGAQKSLEENCLRAEEFRSDIKLKLQSWRHQSVCLKRTAQLIQ